MWRSFRGGLLAGLMAALAGTLATVYVLNMLGFVVVSVSRLPHIQDILLWAYANLRLSVIPFTFILILYLRKLRKLNALLDDADVRTTEVFQTERWVDSAVSLFFGIGVIWTAIGMRSALLFALGGLDQTTAVHLGAFEILRRLVDGGILLALSTTIVGAVGGYLMRVGKTVVVGAKLQEHHSRLASAPADRFDQRLRNIERDVARISSYAPSSHGPTSEVRRRLSDVEEKLSRLVARDRPKPSIARGSDPEGGHNTG